MMRSGDDLLHLCIAYTRFNASRTLGSAAESRFEVRTVAGAHLIMDPARPDSGLCNRVWGFRRGLDEVLAAYGEIRPQFDLDDVRPDVVRPLLERGYRPCESIIYLARRPEPLSTEGPVVERWTRERADDFRELLGTSGATCTDEIWNLRRALYCTDEFRTYVALVDGEPRAWATLFVADERAYLANAFTQPQFRSRGCHTALLAARMNDSVELGLRWVATDVEANSASHLNCLRTSFEPLASHGWWRPLH
jgi:hypothetical protein